MRDKLGASRQAQPSAPFPVRNNEDGSMTVIRGQGGPQKDGSTSPVKNGPNSGPQTRSHSQVKHDSDSLQPTGSPESSASDRPHPNSTQEGSPRMPRQYGRLEPVAPVTNMISHAGYLALMDADTLGCEEDAPGEIVND